MPQRGYVLVFFIWALIAIITPTLVSWSSASGESNMDSQGGARIEVKVRRMMVLMEKSQARNTTTSSTFTQAPAPAPAPTMVGGNETYR
ncbi:hypothetical protein J5N97_028007 [Dioscorea zingiberensis]|uniref:Uncharacterized protein n=1 Tax=Dioscorea zingiberensis TaxID=325984 RepID=A0A9D5BY96_9LILI|nr:hypothetical protein J5N97_028007 [Dioscorea zingiberensis]